MDEPLNTELRTWIKPSTSRRLQSYVKQEQTSEGIITELALSNFLDLMELSPHASNRRRPGRRPADAPPSEPTIKKHLDLSYGIAEDVRQKAKERGIDFTDAVNEALAEWLVRRK